MCAVFRQLDSYRAPCQHRVCRPRNGSVRSRVASRFSPFRASPRRVVTHQTTDPPCLVYRPRPQLRNGRDGRVAGHQSAAPIPRPALHRQRLRGAHLRDRLVSAAEPHRRLVRHLDRRAARHVHGRHVHREPAASPEVHLAPPSIRCASTRCSKPAIAVFGLLVFWGLPYVGGLYFAIARARHERTAASRLVLRALPAAADDPHGRDAPGDRALGRDDAAKASRGSASSTAATSPARCSAACSPASICCACTTWRTRRTSPSRSTSSSRAIGLALAQRDAVSRRGRRHRRCAADAARSFRPARGRSTHDRTLGRDGARRRSGVDAPALAPARRDDVHLLADPRRVPDRTRHRQQRRIGRSRGRRSSRGARWACARLLLIGAIAWAAYSMTKILPYWPVNPGLLVDADVHVPDRLRALPLGRAARGHALGRELPARARRGGSRRRRIRRDWSARVYAANTVGGIVGALFGSLLIIAWLGTQDARSAC